MMTRRLSRFVAASSLLGLIALAGASVTDDSHSLLGDTAMVSEPVVQVWGARTRGIKGVFGVHSWIATKPAGAREYTVYEVVGWRLRWTDTALVKRVRTHDHWFGAAGELYAEKRGAGVDDIIARVDKLAQDYPYAKEYTLWPGPNSNTFVAWVTRQIPELGADLPATAIGKDYTGRKVFGSAPSGRGIQLSLGGLLGFSASGVEGFELNLLSLNFGVGPGGLKLPLVGRVGSPRIDPALELPQQASAETGPAYPGPAN
jgi:hypothetical protein